MRIDRGEQALLFLNRRGYAPLTLCRTCGHQYQCPDCSTWLVAHRFRGVLDVPSLRARDPRARSLRGMRRRRTRWWRWGRESSASPRRSRTGSPARGPWCCPRTWGRRRNCASRLAEIARGEYDIVIGTQLVAKGHHFARLIVVGVIDADLGLAHGDPRAAEKTFQVLTQVTGRAGRASRHGMAYLQTYHPEHAVMKAMIAGDREGFYAHELQVRNRPCCRRSDGWPR